MRTRFFVPETIQASAVDCGPAALKSLLEGFGIGASYGRLREACQTSLDGTSIDTIELVAREVGLDAQQIMVPPDHLRLDKTILPAVVVLRLPNGFAHFVVVWRRVGSFFQIMDPAMGRRWVRAQDLLSSVYLHRQVVSASAWRDWASSAEAKAVLLERIASFSTRRFASDVIERTAMQEGWTPLARLDAGGRLVDALVRSGALRHGREAQRLLEALQTGEGEPIPAPFWSVSPIGTGANAEVDEEQIVLRGAVLIRIGRLSERRRIEPTNRELAAAVREAPVRPLARVVSVLSPQTRRALPLVTLAALVLGVTTLAEGLLFRSMFDFVAELGLPQERLAMLAAFAIFATFLVALDYAVTSQVIAWGRELQARFGSAYLTRLSSLRSEYFGSRLVSDLAERSHAVVELRTLPILLLRGARAASTFALTFVALLYLMPQASGAIIVGALSLLMATFAFEPVFEEIELRARSHAGGLTRFYLDALAGLGTIHAHCAERVVRREHESLMTDWIRAIRRQIAAAVSQTTILAVLGFTMTAFLIRRHLMSVDDPAGVLLIAYWSLNLPVVAAEIAQAIQTWASQRSVIVRLVEPLDAPPEDSTDMATNMASTRGVAIEMRGAGFGAAGRQILSDVHLSISPGQCVGIVGASGAGKSTLVGALLGWMQPNQGEVRIDGAALTPARVRELRRHTAWVDPGIQLFNVPMEENVRYASGRADVWRLPMVLNEAHLYEVLQRLPDSQMPLGEGGGNLSGGEGQRVRLARALMQHEPRLVILDEAFRGMDRSMRGELLRRCRRLWSGATFLVVTHDVDETVDCDLVIVMRSGSVVECDRPDVLIARPASLYNSMRESNRAIREELWGSPTWRRVELRNGRLAESPTLRAISEALP